MVRRSLIATGPPGSSSAFTLKTKKSPSGHSAQSAYCVVETKGLNEWHDVIHSLREMQKFLSTALQRLRAGSGSLSDMDPKGFLRSSPSLVSTLKLTS